MKQNINKDDKYINNIIEPLVYILFVNQNNEDYIKKLLEKVIKIKINKMERISKEEFNDKINLEKLMSGYQITSPAGNVNIRRYTNNMVSISIKDKTNYYLLSIEKDEEVRVVGRSEEDFGVIVTEVEVLDKK